jgi:thiamine biosynthesis lipoprotein
VLCLAVPVNDAYWTDRSLRAMGTTARVLAGGAPHGVLEWAFEEIERLEDSWSRFRPGSELSELNRSEGRWFPMSPRLSIAIERAGELWRRTRGAFDPTILPALEASGYDRSFETIVPDMHADQASPARVAGFGVVELDVEAHQVRVPPGVRIDLGGVGKGLAADLLAEGLIERGARTALVSLGGDMRASGESPAGGWPVPVIVPERGVAFVHQLHVGALAQSSCLLRSWRRGGRAVHHIIDPRTGTATDTDVASVVVAGAEAWWSEGLAKAAIVLGPSEGGALLRREAVQHWMFDRAGSPTPGCPVPLQASGHPGVHRHERMEEGALPCSPR